MISYTLLSFLAVLIFCLVHLFAEKIRQFSLEFQGRLLSIGGGIAISYIFVDLLPKLSSYKAAQDSLVWVLIPYFEKHAYLMALIGFLLFYTVDRAQFLVKTQSAYYYLSISAYILFNFFVGNAIADRNNPEVQPLLLFTLAMSLHYLMNDYSLCSSHGDLYRNIGKKFLIMALFLGWGVGIYAKLSKNAVSLISAFIGGGVIMNVTRHELGAENPSSLPAFIIAALAYAFFLLTIG